MTFDKSRKDGLAKTSIPLQFDIMVAGGCNAHCAFCVQEATWKPQTVNDETFLQGIGKHFQVFYRMGGRRVVITGGEPTLFMGRVMGVLEVLEPYRDLEVKAVYTNGSLLLDICSGKEPLTIAQAMREAGLQDINFSVHHHLDEINNRILRLPQKPTTEEITKHLLECGLRVRFNLTLQKECIDNYIDFRSYINEAFRLGATDIYVRELFQYSFDQAISLSTRDAIRVSRERYVPYRPLVNQAVSSGEFEFLEQKQERVRDKTEITLLHRATSCNVYVSTLTIGTEKPESLPYLIYMPDAYLYKGWLGNQDRTNKLAKMGEIIHDQQK